MGNKFQFLHLLDNPCKMEDHKTNLMLSNLIYNNVKDEKLSYSLVGSIKEDYRRKQM